MTFMICLLERIILGTQKSNKSDDLEYLAEGIPIN